MSDNTNTFERWNNAIRAGEGSLVNVFSALAPWGAPLGAAYMAYHGMRYRLGFDPVIAGIMAAVIEILGLATVSTALQFWQHNRRYQAGNRQQPVKLAAGMFAFYLAVVLVVNVLLEWPTGKESEFIPVIARGILSLLSIPAAITLAVRTQYAEMLKQIEHEDAVIQVEQAAAQKEAAQSEETRLRLAMEKELALAEIAANTKAQVQIARIQARAGSDKKRQNNDISRSVRHSDKVTDIPTFRRGYDGFVDYVRWIDGQGGDFDKNHAAQTMGRSTRQIERYVEHGRNNGLADKFP